MAGNTAELLVLVRARDQASRALGRIRGAASGMGQAVRRGALIGGVALAGAGIAAVKFAADFEAAMSKSVAIMGDVSDAMRNDMERAARDVALTTTFSAEQAAESYFFLASAGLDAAQSIQALPVVANFAQAGMFDMALATDLLTDAQSALGLSVDDTAQNMENMNRVSDVLVKANTLANATVQQFSEALTNKAGAALRATNKDVEEGVAVLAAFADQGIKGTEAGTQFGIVMRDLQTKALANKDAFAQAGVAVFDAQGNMNNMADIIGDLEGSLDGMSTATQKATLLQLGFSDKSVSALQALLGTSDAIREYEGELRNAQGITDEIAAKQLENFNAQLSLLKSAFQDVFISVGQLVLPILTKFTTLLRTDILPTVQTLGALIGATFQRDGHAMHDTFNQLNPKLFAFGQVVINVTRFVRDDLVPAFMQVVRFVKDDFLPVFLDGVAVLQDDFLPVLQKVGQWFARNKPFLIAAIAAVGVAILIALGPAAIAVAAIIGFIALMGLLKQNWATITAFFDEHLGFLKAIFDGAFTIIRARIQFWVDFVTNLFALAQALWAGDWGAAWEAIKALFSDAFSNIMDEVRGWVTLISGIFGLAKAAWLIQWDVFKVAMAGVWGAIKRNTVDKVVELADTVWATISGLPRRLLDLVGAWAAAGRGLGNAIRDGLLQGLRAVGGFIASLATEVMNAIKAVINIGIDAINNLIPNKIAIKFAPDIDIPDNPIPRLARGAFVTSPTLAVIGDAPGGEAVLNLPQIAALAGAGGGGNVEVHIHGGLMGDQIDALRIARVTERAQDRARRR